MAERDVVERLKEDWQGLLEAQRVRPETSPLGLPRARRMPSSRAALLAQLEEVRVSWAELRGEVDEALAERYANAGWTLKDLLAHLASWAAEFRREVDAVARREELDYAIPFAMSVVGPNEWNEEQVASRRARSLESIFEEFERETAGLEELVAEMGESELYAPSALPLAPSGDPSERFRAPAAVLIAGKCVHDRYHLEQIRDRLRRFR